MTGSMKRERALLIAQAHLLQALEALDAPDGDTELYSVVIDAYSQIGYKSKLDRNPYIGAMMRGRPLATADGELIDLLQEMNESALIA